MEKMKLPLQQFLTLVGPAQKLEIVDESHGQKNDDESAILFSGMAVKTRNHEELLPREVKHIQPTLDSSVGEKTIFKIWVY